MKPWWAPDARASIALIIILTFCGAYFRSPSDTLEGALIAAFAGAWGYFLGSSKGSADNGDRTKKALDIAAEAQAQAKDAR